MTTAYLRQFEDYPRATSTLDTFEKRWPQNPYSAEATYLRYLVALRTNDLKGAATVSASCKQLQRHGMGRIVAPPPGEPRQKTARSPQL